MAPVPGHVESLLNPLFPTRAMGPFHAKVIDMMSWTPQTDVVLRKQVSGEAQERNTTNNFGVDVSYFCIISVSCFLSRICCIFLHHVFWRDGLYSIDLPRNYTTQKLVGHTLVVEHHLPYTKMCKNQGVTVRTCAKTRG